MKAILLCGGFGTRMAPLTDTCPKPLLEVAGRPVIDYLVDQVLAWPGLSGIDVVSNAAHFELYKPWKDGWSERLETAGLELGLHDDGAADNQSRLGAVGDLAFALASGGVPDGAFVAAADNIFRFPLLPAWQRFLETDKNHVISLYEEDLAKRQRTGVLELANDDRVIRQHEKPEHPPSFWTCPPLYFLNRRALERVPEFRRQHPDLDAPGNFSGWLAQREPVYAFKIRGTRFDIGSMESYREADRVLGAESVFE